MPEGPEVFKQREYLQDVEYTRITNARVISGRYIRNPLNLAPLRRGKFTNFEVHGKLMVMWFIDSAEEEYAVLSTMGMTGCWVIDPPLNGRKHVRISIMLEGGRELCFIDQRNFGTFKIVDPKEAKRKMAELGADLMKHGDRDFARAVFPVLKERIERFGKSMTIAEALLDQRIFAGVGNYIRADAMYMARVNPNRPVKDFTYEELLDLWCWLRQVALCAYRDEHLILGKPYAYASPCYGCGVAYYKHPVETFEDRFGRTVHWSPAYQT